jgi:nicotinamidase/pyrazinamidase
VPDGDTVADPIGRLVASGDYDLIVATRDWHPPDHESFAAQGGPWPAHCVAGSHGAEFHPSLDRAAIDWIADTGTTATAAGYSGFEATELEQRLRDRGVDEITVCGLATDYCVKHTVLDALRAGFAVKVVADAVQGVEVEPGDSRRALDEMVAAGARLV